MDLLLDSSMLTTLATGDHPIGGFLDKMDLITNNNCAELLSTIRKGVISNDFDDTFDAINNITPEVNPKVLVDAI